MFNHHFYFGGSPVVLWFVVLTAVSLRVTLCVPQAVFELILVLDVTF